MDTNLRSELEVAIRLAKIEVLCRDVRPKLPAKIAMMERVAQDLSPDEQLCSEHMIRVTKMILFFANELADLEKSKPENLNELAVRSVFGRWP
jgi:hypothetical protein